MNPTIPQLPVWGADFHTSNGLLLVIIINYFSFCKYQMVTKPKSPCKYCKVAGIVLAFNSSTTAGQLQRALPHLCLLYQNTQDVAKDD